MKGWTTTDIIIVTGNIIISVVSLLPIVFFLFVIITSYTPYSTYNPKELLTVNDLIARPMSIFFSRYLIDEWVITVGAIILSYGISTIV